MKDDDDLTALDDTELERRAARGDRDAFDALYRRHASCVHDFLLRMLRDPDDAADLMQETFMRAMGALSEKRAGSAAFSVWLRAIARNLALTRMDRRKRTVPLGSDDDDDEAPAYARLDPTRLADPEQAAEAHELASFVWQAARGLEAKQYSLLDLHVRQGLDSAEIAQVLGVSKGNAYTMLSRLRDNFESSVAGLVMFQRGRRQCAGLDRLLRERAVTAMSPPARRLIERHTADCPTCSDQRRRLVSATAILRALALLALPLALERRVAEAAWQACRAQHAEPESATAGQAQGPGFAWTRARIRVRGGHLGRPVWIAGAAAILAALSATATCVVLPAAGVHFAGSGSSTPTGRTGSVSAVFRPPASVTPFAAVGGQLAAPTVAPTTHVDASPAAPPTAAQALASPTKRAVAPNPPTVPPAAPACNVAPAPVLGLAPGDSGYASAMLNLSDQYRTAHGLRPLVVDPRLTAAAAEYARFVVETQWWLHHPPAMTFDGTLVPGIHIDPSCHDMYDRAVADGYPPATIGENVMWGSSDLPSASMFSIILGSADHEDPANGIFVYTGIACYVRPTPAPAERACVQLFASPP